jgi:hypothetical protein
MIEFGVSSLFVIIGRLGRPVIFISKLIGMDEASAGFRGDSQRPQIDASPREVHRPGQDIDDGLGHALDPEMQLVIAWRDVAEDEGIARIRYGKERRWECKYDRAHLGMDVAKDVGDAFPGKRN